MAYTLKYKHIVMLFIFFIIPTFPVYAVDIILDPGHNPNKPGAISCTGVYEYKYNDELTNIIKTTLFNNNIEANMTRTPSQDISLIDRTHGTEDAKLFISIHHDSVQPQFIKYINGNPTTAKAEGYSIFVSRKNKYFQQSVEYAKRLAKNLHDIGLMQSYHHGEKIKGENRLILDKELGIYIYDDLIVLKNSQCPAILFEAGVIVNPLDERRVKEREFKSNVSKAIVDAIRNYTN